MLALVTLAALIAASSPAPPPAEFALPAPQRVLALVRAKFRSHRPPPPYVSYTVERAQKDTNGFPDYTGTYTYRVWTRSLDRASLARKVGYQSYARGPLEFQRPAFNEPRDPGPPTADLFEPAPARPHTLDFVPTPEPVQTELPTIGSIRVLTEYDYKVVNMDVQGELVHLKLEPYRDPDRNRLRDLWADKTTYELKRLVATDKLFYGDKGPIFGVLFTATLGMLQGMPVVTDLHGVVGDGFAGDGREVDFHFRDIAFPATLPGWYFEPRGYAAHVNDAPS